MNADAGRERRAAALSNEELVKAVADHPFFKISNGEDARLSDQRYAEWNAAQAELLRRLNVTDAVSAAAGSDRERLYGYLENINSHLGSLRNAFGVVRHVENSKIGTPVYHLQAAEEYVSLLYNLMVKFVPDPDAAAESAEASGDTGGTE